MVRVTVRVKVRVMVKVRVKVKVMVMVTLKGDRMGSMCLIEIIVKNLRLNGVDCQVTLNNDGVYVGLYDTMTRNKISGSSAETYEEALAKSLAFATSRATDGRLSIL